MSTLIVPMAGRSSRFPNSRPKWMLTHPLSKTYMVLESISGLNLDFFDKIVFVMIKEQIEKNNILPFFKEELSKLNIEEKSEICVLDNWTKSQSETVYEAITRHNIRGYIYIKDCDSYFKIKLSDKKNLVSYFDLHNMKYINAISKSYIDIDSNAKLTNIVEKKIISTYFNVGGYGFEEAGEFVSYFNKINTFEKECYISNVIFEMMLDNKDFYGQLASNYEDWGTLEDWENYTKQFRTLFIDLDGTLVENSSHLFFPKIGDGLPLTRNIETIKKLYSERKTYIIITTSRPEEFYQDTVDELCRNEIPFDKLIMGLPHSQRIIINDFSNSNKYPSCSSINVQRNTETLGDYLR
jgi:hydroxymethylpyrimidine pyrophosphatase-like HAD family hydrolase